MSSIRTPLFAALFALALTACATPQVSATPASAAPITAASVRALLVPLTDDSMEGRAVWTAGEKRAARMIAEQMQRIGLEPAGDSGYYQRIPGAVREVTRTRVSPAGDTTRTTSMRAVRLASFADWDSIPVARRRWATNVIGVIRGTLPDSVILVDAHYDHLGIAAPVTGARCPFASPTDSIFNGADDDASGTVAVLEIARIMKGEAKPRRTLIFSAMTGEENGLVGTGWYILHPLVPIASMVANLEIEMIGRPDSLAGGSGRAWLTGYERSTMGDMLKSYGIAIGPDLRPAQRFFERSDNIAFARAGVPAHTLSTFNLHQDYHCASDESSRVDFEHMAGVIRAGAEAVKHLANGPAPAWHDGGRPAAPAPRP
ncbi:MAG: peptidase [Gemmatimonadetes bacterium]|nr:peptidase [Gemmatimonadota bacterium]